MQTLTDLTRYVYGTTRLGDDTIPFDDRVRVAQEAMDAGLWFHTSHTYGDALQVIRATANEGERRVPPAIFKIGWESVDQVRDVIRQNLEPLEIGHMPIGQLCLGGNLAEEFRKGGDSVDSLNRLKEEGLVGRFVLETWPWNSQVAFDAIRSERSAKLIDGLIFYLNPLQRFVSNDLWDLIQDRQFSIVAMRTVAGGSVTNVDHQPEYLQKRAAEVHPIFERCGCGDWPSFCVRFAHSFPNVRATVGATSRAENLQGFIKASQDIQPLQPDILQDIVDLQRKWYEQHDRFAEPWSM